jgi:hypothetical protein
MSKILADLDDDHDEEVRMKGSYLSMQPSR